MKVYHSWLDRWDERRALRGEDGKEPEEFILDAERGFPGAKKSATIEEFCDLADQAAADPTFFDLPIGGDDGFESDNGWVRFPSEIVSDIKENNTVWAKVTESGSFDQALVVFHHWNASSRQHQLARFFSRRGITVVEIVLPYHFERSRPGSSHADHMLSPNLGQTIQAVRQGVLDGRKLIGWLKDEGYGEISVLGLSLGSWVAGLVAAHDPSVSKAALILTAGSLADMVWTGRATQAVRDSLEPEIGLTDLRRAWSPINLENYAHKLARPNLDLHVVLAKRDTVVLPALSETFMQILKDAGGEPNMTELNCGHYSLSIPPYNFLAGLKLKRLLRRGR